MGYVGQIQLYGLKSIQFYNNFILAGNWKVFKVNFSWLWNFFKFVINFGIGTKKTIKIIYIMNVFCGLSLHDH